MRDFIKLLTMILAFLLLLITIVTEVQSHAAVSDMDMLLIVMATATLVPAAAKPVYLWMIAEKESDSERREALREKRSSLVLRVSLLVAVVLLIRVVFRFFAN